VQSRAGRTRADWSLVVPLGVLTLTAYAIWIYAFGVQVEAMSLDLGWSEGRLGFAFGGAQLLTGIAAVVVGSALDRRPPALVIGGIGLAGCAALAGASALHSPFAFCAAYACGGGLIAGAGFYSATMGVIIRSVASPKPSINALTIIGAFCAPIFIPLIRWGTIEHGWRPTLLVMAWLNTLIFVIVALRLRHLAAPSTKPAASFLRRVGPSIARSSTAGRALLVAGFFSGYGLGTAIAFQIPAMTAAGIASASAAGFASLRALMQLGGRLPLTPIVARFGSHRALIGAYVAGAVGLALLVAADRWAIGAAYAVVCGIGFGATSPLNGMVGSDEFDAGSMGALLGAQSALSSLGSALGPAVTGVMLDVTNSYTPGLITATAALGIAAAVMIVARRPSPDDDGGVRAGVQANSSSRSASPRSSIAATERSSITEIH
jgi:MFS family permease